MSVLISSLGGVREALLFSFLDRPLQGTEQEKNIHLNFEPEQQRLFMQADCVCSAP